MSRARIPEDHDRNGAPARAPRSVQDRAPEGKPDAEPDPTGQSPEDPIEFARNDDVARGNAERANAEPEPAALHDAEVPGKPDAAQHRRDIAKQHDH